MTTENHPIDQLFKEKLGSLEKNPPAGLMDQISAKVAFRGKIRRMNQVKTVIGIAAAMLLIMMAGWYSMDQTRIAKNQMPLQIPQINTPALAKTNQESLDIKPTVNQIAANQHTIQTTPAKNTSLQSAKPSKSLTVQKNKVVSASVSDGASLLAAQTASKEPSKAAKQEENTVKTKAAEEKTVVKEKSKTESGSNNFQKKNPPLYFADAGVVKQTPSRESGKGNWGITAELSPSVASQSVSGATANTTQQSTVSGGMLASYQVSKRIKVSSGIRFSQMKQDTHTSYTLSQTSGITYLQPVDKAANLAGDVSLYLPAVSSIVYSNGMKTNPTDNFTSDIAQELKYLEVPFQATYKIIDTYLSVGVTGGLSTNFLVGNHAIITQNGINLSNGSTGNVRDILFSSSAGIEVGYGLAKNLIITIEPRIKQYLNSVSSNDQVNYKPTQIGIFTGLTFSFN